jgi:Dyp-type peroxidase family
VLVSVFARKRDVLVRRRDEVRDSLEPDPGLELVHEIEAALLDHPAEGAFAREHFGFADGLSQPTIAGNAGPYSRPGGGTPTEEGGWKDVAPGEFVLGYLDEDGVTSDQPAEPLRQSGSFLVVRKLHQDVALFTRYLKDAAKGDPAREELLAAKIVGRWRDGTPLVLSPNRPDPALATDRGEGGRINDFRYDADPGGRRCPLGAHIRRANPRDALGWNGALTKRHRIIRRGMPYGVQPADRAVDDGQDRGLMFVCYQASISRQFEAIQAHWLNDGNPFGLGSDRDFLVENEDPRGKMTIQGEPPTFLSPQRSFVTTKGGGYFFTPGVRALRTLAAGDWL